MIFKKILFFLLITNFAFAQIQDNASWKLSSSKNNPAIGETIDLIFDVKIKDGYHMYSSDFSPEVGPVVTTIKFNNKGYKTIGALKAINPIKKYDELFGGDVKYFEHKAKFVQKIQITEANPNIIANSEFQTCQDDGSCVMGKKALNLNLKTKPEAAKKDSVSVKVETQEAQPQYQTIQPAKNIESNLKTEPKPADTQSLWKFLLIAFGAGLASIFMPCIYPIMPMTVSFFTKQSNGKSKAVFYGLSIMAIFGVMGLITMAFGAPFLNFLSTHWIPNLIFFVIFILFGVSLLGAFEIVLPHETVNKIDRLGDKGGLIGIFFMALTLVVVSFSCTVPFVGSLLIAAAQGEVMRPIYGMLAFGLPFAIVFAGLAMFPQYLKSLPKSGGWLNELKAVFGLLEFALALKFLSNIDLAYHWNLIHRNVFLTIWIVIAVVIGLYILGFMRLKKDDKIVSFAPSRIFFATIFFAIAAYMLPGVTNKPLELLSGILPPMPIENNQNLIPAGSKLSNLPQNLQGYKNFEDAAEAAQKLKKPILIDFTGHACANCRKMEEFVWSKPEVNARLKNDFVIASLYVDEKTELPKDQQYISKYDNQLKSTVGDKNMDFEITKFNNNAQPYYVIVYPNGEKIIEPKAFCSAEEFVKFLDEGKSKYNLK